MGIYKVEVGTATHDDLRNGDVETETVCVVVSASTDSEAILLATQIAACNRRGAMPTRAFLLNFPT